MDSDEAEGLPRPVVDPDPVGALVPGVPGETTEVDTTIGIELGGITAVGELAGTDELDGVTGISG